MDSEKLIRSFIEEVFTKGNLAALDEYLATNFVEHDRSTMPGYDSIKQTATTFLTAIPDQQTTIDDIITDGHDVAVRITIQGIHKGNLFRVPPAGKKVTVVANNLANVRSLARMGES